MKKKNKSAFTQGQKVMMAGAAVLALMVGVVSGGVGRFVLSGYDGSAPKWLYISESTTTDSLRRMLVDSLGTMGENTAAMMRLTATRTHSVRGAYRVDPGTSPIKLWRRLTNGRQTPVRLTFNNLRTLDQLAARVASRLDVDSATFMAACDSVLPQVGFAKSEYPAAFLPDSYEFYWTASPRKVVEELLDHRNNFWTPDRRAKATALGLTPVEAAVIASIAEEETNSQQERGVVARLYINRLRKGMRLQADPTVKFAVGNFALRRITGEHLSVESPYNTYRNSGLPPGPIRIASAATIDGLLDSTPHSYLYMCAKDDFSGRHNFATTFAEHQQNAARYHKALNRHNIN